MRAKDKVGERMKFYFVIPVVLKLSSKEMPRLEAGQINKKG